MWSFSKAFLKVNSTTLSLNDGLQTAMKDVVEKETKKEDQEQAENNFGLTSWELETALKGTYKSFMVPGLPNADIDGYVNRDKANIKALIEGEIKELQSIKVIMTLWLR